jgi:hypothetical protein
MNDFILIPIAVLFFGVNGTLTRLFQLRYQKSKAGIFLYQTLFCFVAFVSYLTQSTKSADVSLFTIGMAIGMGIAFFLALFGFAICFETGSMAITSVVINLSLIIPMIYSWVFLSEPIYQKSIFGLMLLAVTFVLSAFSSKEKGKHGSTKWFLFLLMGFFANGMSAVLQKQHQIQLHGKNAALFMAIGYLTASLLFALFFFLKKESGAFHVKTYATSKKAFLSVSILSGISVFAGNGILMILSSRVNGGILYPCLNGGLCILLSFISIVFFREKFTLPKGLSILFGLCAIVLLGT